MANHQSELDLLLIKIERLKQKQDFFSKEIIEIQKEVFRLKSFNPELEKKDDFQITPPKVEVPIKKEIIVENVIPFSQKPIQSKKVIPKGKSDLEKFIGENLLNKIGILITVIGVGIGAKYSIEHDLISPLTRIILGYFAGLGLLGFGIKLKKNYTSYSAVLVSGAMAILYFITFFAYSFYGLIPQLFTFALMSVFTVFTVIAALNYNKQIIAHIGLVGAYAVPFLLSDGSGKVAIMFSYMAIINIGILVIAFKKYWKPLYYVSFLLTWFIFLAWYFFDYSTTSHFAIGFIFSTIFFSIFYITFLAYKFKQKEIISSKDVILLLLNSFIYYGIGYSILSNHETGEQLLGLFTLLNAIIHFSVSAFIFKKKLADKKIFYIISGMVLVFITIAIPVQLDGNWVTLLWVSEAALLFWIGRTKNITLYERISYALITLAIISLLQDWAEGYRSYYYKDEIRIKPFINTYFLTSVLFISAFGFMTKISRDKNYTSPLPKAWMKNLFSIIIPGIFIFTLYYSFYLEIGNYFNMLYSNSEIKLGEGTQYYNDHVNNEDIRIFKIVWLLIYSLFFVSLLSIINRKKIKDKGLGIVTLVLSFMALASYLAAGLYELSELRVNYLAQSQSEYYNQGIFNIGIRYISYVFVVLLILEIIKSVKTYLPDKSIIKLTYLALNIAVLWIASSELISWLDMASVEQSYKLGLSILWGIYSLSLIVYGIWKNKQYLRIGAIALFVVTLLKLFFYDISHLNTIAKTVVFVSLGIILLIISFLYNKYKNQISDEDKSEE
ncbi:MAG: DUF2339 domain-containing protein [Flavobacteriaceae bacterium]